MNKGTLFLSYYSNYRNFHEDWILVPVSRIVPRWVDYDYYAKSLSPSQKLLNEYKYEDLSWDEFIPKFINELSNNDGVERDLKKIQKLLEEGKEVCLLCYEKGNKCHRFILAELFTSEYSVVSLIGDKEEIIKEW